MSKSILFTGANGLIGSEVYKYFEDKYGKEYELHRIDKSVNLDLCDSDAVNHWMPQMAARLYCTPCKSYRCCRVYYPT